MSNLSDDEVELVLQQLIEQMLPDRPSDEEAQAVVAWAEGVRIGGQMLVMVLAGEAFVRIVDGQPRFKLTAQGMADAEALLAQSPDARALHDQLVADTVGKPFAKGPDGEQ